MDTTTNTITINATHFEVVEKIPAGYEILTDIQSVPAGHLPVGKMFYGTRNVDPSSCKLVPTSDAEKIMTAAKNGLSSLAAMEDFAAKNKNAAPGSWVAFRLKSVKEAIPIIRKISANDMAFDLSENGDRTDFGKSSKRKSSDKSQYKKDSSYHFALRFLKEVKPDAASMKAAGISAKQFENIKNTIRNSVMDSIQRVNPRPIESKFIKHQRGQPLFIQELIGGEFTADCKMARWVICDSVDKENETITFSHVGTFRFEDYLKTWRVFNAKP